MGTLSLRIVVELDPATLAPVLAALARIERYQKRAAVAEIQALGRIAELLSQGTDAQGEPSSLTVLIEGPFQE
jgi:hypothetical protein